VTECSQKGCRPILLFLEEPALMTCPVNARSAEEKLNARQKRQTKGHSRARYSTEDEGTGDKGA
jgi:hypothetical protein